MIFNSRSKAFSIVEISIVLVVSGLLVFTAFKGFGVIKKAKVNSIIRQVGEVINGVNAFKEANGALPGDATSDVALAFGSTADTFDITLGITPAATTTAITAARGNGDGFIDFGSISSGTQTLTCTNSYVHEANAAWYHLFYGNYLSDNGIVTSDKTKYLTNVLTNVDVTTNPSTALSTYLTNNQILASTKVDGLYMSFYSTNAKIGSTTDDKDVIIPNSYLGFKGNSLILGSLQLAAATVSGFAGDRVTSSTSINTTLNKACQLKAGTSVVNPFKPILKGAEADLLDKSMDDGISTTGIIRSKKCNTTTAATTDFSCKNDTSTEALRTVAILLNV
jgi:hypothetical protein